MEEDKTLTVDIDEDTYDPADRPFDFVGADEHTAIVCESDPEMREKICNVLKSMDFQITEALTARDGIKKMHYHAYDLIIVNENFEADSPDKNIILLYLEKLKMAVRRDIFVILISERFRTMDYMAAFNKSVNIIINTQNIDDIESIISRGMAVNEVFYHVFKEAQKKTGRA
jgi:hypothetical protein